MSGLKRLRLKHIVEEAEGYLELGLAEHALDILGKGGLPGSLDPHMLHLKGEALRTLGRYEEAIETLQQAADLKQDATAVWLAMGWCLKRTGQIHRAIECLDRALALDEFVPLVVYNLACYWTLAGNKKRALGYLAEALELEPKYRELIDDESDFDSLREDSDFRALTSIIV